MNDMFARLAAEFPRDAVHWRAQTLTGSGDKALALAYIDARDVMDRLDEVCTPAGWTNECIETPKGRIIGRIGILIGEQWVYKTDGAGDTDVEGEKGGISDALKRAAVLWGIGRYLYRMPSVWAPCESTEKNGKRYWKAWKGSPWDAVRQPQQRPQSNASGHDALNEGEFAQITTLLEQTSSDVRAFCEHFGVSAVKLLPASRFDEARAILNRKLRKAA